MKSFLRAVQTVLWAFLGIRKQSKRLEDAQLNPIAIIATAILLGIIFIITLMLVVNYVVKG